MNCDTVKCGEYCGTDGRLCVNDGEPLEEADVADVGVVLADGAGVEWCDGEVCGMTET